MNVDDDTNQTDERPESDMARRIRRLEERTNAAERRSRWTRVAAIALVFGGLSLPFVANGLGTVPNTFVTGAAISASQMNANFQHLVDGITAVEDRFVASATPAVSPSSGAQSFPNTTYVSVTGLTASHLSSGNPVLVSLIADADASNASYIFSNGLAGTSDGYFQIERNGTPICQLRLQAEPAGTHPTIPPGAITCLDDSPPAGTNSYTISVRTAGAGSVALINVRLMANETGWLP